MPITFTVERWPIIFRMSNDAIAILICWDLMRMKVKQKRKRAGRVLAGWVLMPITVTVECRSIKLRLSNTAMPFVIHFAGQVLAVVVCVKCQKATVMLPCLFFKQVTHLQICTLKPWSPYITAIHQGGTKLVMLKQDC